MTGSTDSKTEQYEALAEMGIMRFHEISHYSLRQDGADTDILRINYKRAKGSLLPFSRKYKFGRALKTVVADGGSARLESTYEISPFLLKAISELDKLIQRNALGEDALANEGIKADILSELDSLKALIEQSGSADDLTAKLDTVRKLTQSL